jgi:hypothetical protein
LPSSGCSLRWLSQASKSPVNNLRAAALSNDARQQDAAIDQWALNNGMTDGATVDYTSPSGAETYLKTTWNTVDLLGNAYSYGNVGTQQVQIAPATKNALAGVSIDWGPY